MEDEVTPSRNTSGRSSPPEKSSLVSEGDAQVRPEDAGCLARTRRLFKDNLLMTLSVLGVAAGFIVGFAVRTADPSKTVIMWLGLPGELFLNLLKMTIVPVIVSSVISATSTMDPKENGKIGGYLLLYLVGSNLIIGSGLGIAFGYIMQLGFTSESALQKNLVKPTTALQTSDIVADLLRNLFPENLVRTTIQKAQTEYSEISLTGVNASLGLQNASVAKLMRSVGYVDSVNVMGLIFGSALFGIACSQLPAKSKPFVDFFSASHEMTLLVLSWVLWVTPIGCFSLVCSSVAEVEDPGTIFRQLGLFVAMVTAGLFIQQAVILPLLFFLFNRTNPFLVFSKLAKAWFIAFISGASACAMPYMYPICEDLGYDRRVYKVGIPMMVTFNANGSALFITIASQLLAVMSGVSIDGSQVILTWLLTATMVMALPSVPSASLVTVVIIVTTLGISPASVGLLFTVEWFLDRLRTTSNVVSELFGLGIVNGLVRKDMLRKDRQQASLDGDSHCVDGKVDTTGV